MTDIYYLHRGRLNFYCDSAFGPRQIDVADPEWVRPTLFMPDPDWQPESGNLSASPPMIETPDWQAVAPQITVQNPNCLLPPEDELIILSEAQYLELSAATEMGKVIALNAEGTPCLIDPPTATIEQQSERQRQWRDRLLLSTDTLVVRHRDETESGRATSLTGEQYRELQVFRMALRDWPQTRHFPAMKYQPVTPEWLDTVID